MPAAAFHNPRSQHGRFSSKALLRHPGGFEGLDGVVEDVGELDRKIKAQVQALEKGIEPELVSERIAELRGEKEALEEALAGIGAGRQDAEDEELTAQLERLPDLGVALREAAPEIKRQVFASFDLQIAYDKTEHRVELTATVSEAVADAFENAEALLAEGSSVVVRDIAGARFVSRYDARIIECIPLGA